MNNITIKRAEFTKESLALAIPVKVAITDDHVSRINELISNDEASDSFKENIVSFTSVMTDGGISVTNYINAVQYVTYVLLGKSKTVSWGLVFPDRLNRLQGMGKTGKEIGSHASAFSKTKLVVSVMEHTLTPAYIYNASMFQTMLNNMYAIAMDDDVSPRDRVAAGTEVMKHTAVPEGFTKGGGEGGVDKGASLIEKLADTVNVLASTQQQLIASGGTTAKQVAGSRLYDNGKVIEHE